MLVSDSIPSLINGVSQQPSTLRLPSQVTEQVNAYSSEIDGLRKRPPMIHTALLSESVLDDAYVHEINRDGQERYNVLITDAELQVFTLDGVQKTVSFPDGKAYLDPIALDPDFAFRAVSVSDYTFIVNRGRVVEKDATVDAAAPFQALVVIRQGAYGKNYRVELLRGDPTPAFTTPTDPDSPPTPTPPSADYVYAEFETPNGSTPSDVEQVGQDYLASKLASSLQTTSDAELAGYVIKTYGSVIHISHPGTDFRIKVTDDFGNNGAVAIKDRTQRFSTLPNVAPDGFYLEVVGDETTAFDNFYVKFKVLNPGDGTGVWEECAKAGVQNRLKASTMPHILVREADGTFTFKRATWTPRSAGDDDSSPFPSFVGRTISDVFLYRNRLALLADQNAIISEAGYLFNFFPKTVTTTLDDSPIDIAVTSNSVSLLQSAALFAGRLFLFADQQQIELKVGAGEVLSARGLSSEVAARYENRSIVRPATTGSSAFFIQEAGLYSRLREMKISADGETVTADDVTNQAPAYIPGSVLRLAASTTMDIVAVLSKRYANRLYFYKYKYDGADKLQSALFFWDLPIATRIRSAQFIDTDLHIVYTLPGQGTFAGYFPMATDAADDGGTFLTHLDRRVDETGCSVTFLPAAGSLPDRTQVTTPFNTDFRTALVTRVGDAVDGEVAKIVSYSGKSITVEGDFTSRLFFVGQPFFMRVKLSTLLLRKSTGSGTAVVLGGRLQLRYITVKFSGTGLFYVESTPRGRPTVSLASTSRIMGAVTLNESSVLPEGAYRFPVMCRNTDADLVLVSSNHLPARFQSLEWEGFYTNRDRSL